MHYDLNRGECIFYFSVNALQSYIVLATLPNNLIEICIFLGNSHIAFIAKYNDNV